jgi:hypothetical protein
VFDVNGFAEISQADRERDRVDYAALCTLPGYIAIALKDLGRVGGDARDRQGTHGRHRQTFRTGIEAAGCKDKEQKYRDHKNRMPRSHAGIPSLSGWKQLVSGN